LNLSARSADLQGKEAGEDGNRKQGKAGGGEAMNIIYSTVVTVILLFPWSVLALMVAGSLWEQQKVQIQSCKRSVKRFE
jgi:hypothetical protein